jgi:hypothetical protein
MYASLPPTYGAALPILQRMNQEASRTTSVLAGSRKRPDPPRSLISQSGSLEALITWNAPQKFADIVGWRVYRDNESSLVDSIFDPNSRQYKPKLPANTPTAFYVSSINSLNVESIKIQIIATANNDQMVVSGTGGGTNGTTPSRPPGYGGEPGGGGSRGGRFPL